jgi:hypothetical protein
MLECFPFCWKVFLFNAKGTGRVPIHFKMIYMMLWCSLKRNVLRSDGKKYVVQIPLRAAPEEKAVTPAILQ